MILGIDVGGTFTDIVLLDNQQLKLQYKTPTTEDIFSGVLDALDFILQSVAPEQIQQLNISTTIITNALVRSQLDTVQLLVMPGPGLNVVNSFPVKPFCLKGYVNHLGEICQELEPQQLLALPPATNIAISGKFSVRNPRHEHKLHELLLKTNPHGNFTLASQLSGKLNFIRRTNTCYYALATRKLLLNFEQMLLKALSARKLTCPVNILKADAGRISFATARQNPAELIFTGPAASILGIKALVQPQATCIALDIGGTTTDISFWADGQAILDNKGAKINNYHTSINSFYHHSLGLAGNSCVQFVAGKFIIGPASATPLIFQGTSLTLTDILAYLDLISLGDKLLVQTYLQDNFPQYPALSVAKQILQIALEQFKQTIQALLLELNRQPVYTVADITQPKLFQPTTLIGVGGAAAGLIPLIAQELALEYIIPEFAAVTNAVGTALAKPTIMVNLQANTLSGYYTLSQTSQKFPTPPNFTSQIAYQIAKEHLLALAAQNNLAIDATDIKVVNHEEYPILQNYQQGLAINLTLQIRPGIAFSLLEVQ